MTNKIQDEIIASQKYLLRTINNDLVELCTENVALVEAMIANDSDYSRSHRVDASSQDNLFEESAVNFWLYTGTNEIKSNNKYKGSTAYWMSELYKRLTIPCSKAELKATILLTVLAVDRENSTHITSDSIGPRIITERIYEHRNTLISELKDISKGIKFIAELSKRTSTENKIIKNGKTYYPRENYSFATKFCHYACFVMFKGDDAQDNYSIYDSVVAKNIGRYADYYKIEKPKDIGYNYHSFISLVDSIIQKSGNHISRNGFDHLLWYYYKAR